MTIHVDTDVLNADGGTRTAAITAAFIAVADALRGHRGDLAGSILRDSIAAVSVGIVDGEPVLDLDYSEDSTAEVDFNVVRLGGGGLVEVQGTGEGGTFSRAQLDRLLDLAEAGIDRLDSCSANASGPTGRWPKENRRTSRLRQDRMPRLTVEDGSVRRSPLSHYYLIRPGPPPRRIVRS